MFWVRRSAWIAWLVVSLINICLALNMYPVPDGDSIYFLPAIKAFATSGVSENKVVDLSFETDPSGLGRFLFYPPGFLVFLGSVMSSLRLTSYRGVLFLLAIVRVATVWLLARAFLVVMVRTRVSNGRFLDIIVPVFVVVAGLFLLPSNGRPEILSMLIISGALLLALCISPCSGRHLAVSLCMALLFPVSIANAVVACSFYLFYLWLDVSRPQLRFAFLALVLLAGSLLMVCSYSWAGVPVVDGIRGLSLHSRIQLGRGDSSVELLFFYWKSWMLFGILALAHLALTVCRRIGSSVKLVTGLNGLWALFSMTALVATVYFFGIRSGPIHYNLYAFLPLYQLLALQLFIDLGTRKLVAGFYGALSVLIPAIGLALQAPLHATMLFPYYLSSGSTYVEAKPIFSQVYAGGCAIMHSGGLTVLDDRQQGSQFKMDQASGALVSERIRRLNQDSDCVVAVVQEVNSHNAVPLNMNMVMDFSDRSPWTQKLRSLHVLRSPKGYSFNVYRQDLPLPSVQP